MIRSKVKKCIAIGGITLSLAGLIPAVTYALNTNTTIIESTKVTTLPATIAKSNKDITIISKCEPEHRQLMVEDSEDEYVTYCDDITRFPELLIGEDAISNTIYMNTEYLSDGEEESFDEYEDLPDLEDLIVDDCDIDYCQLGNGTHLIYCTKSDCDFERIDDCEYDENNFCIYCNFEKQFSNLTFGIDVSTFNGTINWDRVKDAGVEYVIIRAALRGANSGNIVVDERFYQNIVGANEAGIPVGVYFFTQAINEEEAIEEAQYITDLISPYSVALPVFIDTEHSGCRSGRADKLGYNTRTNIVRAFCDEVRSAGYTPGVYASKDWYINNIDGESLSDNVIWVAEYGKQNPTYSGKYDMWQCSSKGRVDGISGAVDMNFNYTGF